MTNPTAILLWTVASAGLVACGGQTFTGSSSSHHDAGTTGGSSGTAGGAATSGGAAGSSPTGGRPGAGGRGSTGGASGTGGAAASGGFKGSGGSPASGGAPSTGGFASSGGAPSSGGSPATCSATTCNVGLGIRCCGDSCVNVQNDPHHCGSCDTACPGATPYCSGGQCGTPPCTPPPGDGVCDSLCCGTSCCPPGQICCAVTRNFTLIGCYDPAETGGTCPIGCPSCVCASPDTPIATPDGERAIASLRVGDRVFSVHEGRVVDVPLVRVNRAPAPDHHVVRLRLANGAVLEISAPHPTADGRIFGDLRAGDVLGGVSIREATVIPYGYPSTYDILPASDSGTYFAGGVLIGSTLGGTALSSRGVEPAP